MGAATRKENRAELCSLISSPVVLRKDSPDGRSCGKQGSNMERHGERRGGLEAEGEETENHRSGQE